jgi:RNA polymerase sigma factor (sigma-70 family)
MRTRSRSRFEQMALPHLDAAHTLAFWLVRNRTDAQDVVQDAYVRALRAFDSLRGEDIKPWLLTSVRHVAYRFLSNRQRAGNVIPIEDAFMPRDGGCEFMPPTSDEPSPEMNLIDAQQRGLAMAALAALPPLHREVLALREIEDLSYAEIAVILGAPIGTVMSRISRARLELRSRFGALTEKGGRDAV